MPPSAPHWTSSRPTITDVAALAGVSKATVSNVIRRSGRVSVATTARVLEAIDTLNFRPNGLARDLVSRRARTIGIVVGDMTNGFYAELIKVLERSASARHLTTIVCNTDGRTDMEAERISTLLERRVSGVTMLQFSGDERVLELLRLEGVPATVLSCADERVDCVAVDDRSGMAMAVAHLAQLGHRRIAYATSPLVETATHASRFAGFDAAMRERGLAPELMRAAGGDRDAAMLRGWLAAPDPVTAVVAANDLLAMELMATIESLGRRVPDDVSVVGFDGVALAAHSRIALTTVEQPIAAIANRGLGLLIDRVDHRDDGAPPRTVLLTPRLAVRSSTTVPSR